MHTASNYLIPKGLDRHLWRRLLPAERFYLKGLEVERHGEHRRGVYQEFARGYGVKDYRGLLERGEANRMRLQTPSKFEGAEIGSPGFGATITRQCCSPLAASPSRTRSRTGMTWLKTEVPGYWDSGSPPSSLSSIIWAESIRITGSGIPPPRGSGSQGPVEHGHLGRTGRLPRQQLGAL